MAKRKIEIDLTIDGKQAKMVINNTSGLVRTLTNQTKTAGTRLSEMGNIVTGLNSAYQMASRAIMGVYNEVEKTIDLYKIQEQAEKSLETALGYKSEALLENARAMQELTTHGDEEIIQAQALIAAFVKDEDQIKSLTEATLDLADAKGMSLVAAADLVSKTVGSSTNAMSRYGISVEGAVGSSERMESLLVSINEKFGGQATAKATTETGRLEQAQNRLGDSMERIGSVAVKLIGPMASTFANVTASVVDALIPTEHLSGAIKDEAKEVSTLTMRLTDSQISQEDRIDIYNKLKKINPDIVGGLDAENISIGQLTKNLSNYNKELVKRILIAGQQEEIEAAGRKAADARIGLNKRITYTEDEIFKAEERLYRDEQFNKIKRMQEIKLENLTLDEKLKKMWSEGVLGDWTALGLIGGLEKANEVLARTEQELKLLTENKKVITVSVETEMMDFDESLMTLDEIIKTIESKKIKSPIDALLDASQLQPKALEAQTVMIDHFGVMQQYMNDYLANSKIIKDEFYEEMGFASDEYLQKEIDDINRLYQERLLAGINERDAHAQMLEEKKQLEDDYYTYRWDKLREDNGVFNAAVNAMDRGWTQFIGTVTSTTMTGSEKTKAIWDSMKQMFIQSIGDMVKKWIVERISAAIFGASLQAAEVGKAVATGGAIAMAYAPAATMASLATFGGNAVGAMAGMSATSGLASVLATVPSFGDGGWIDGRPHSNGGVMINAEGGEYVINKDSADKNRELITMINSGGTAQIVATQSGASMEGFYLLAAKFDEQTARLEAVERTISLSAFDEAYTDYNDKQSYVGA